MRPKRTHIDRVYLISVEEPDDYYHKPEGVLFIDNQGYHTLYSADSRFNFLKSVVHKFPYQDLEVGVSFRDHNVRLTDLTDQYRAEFDMTVDEMLLILQRIYETSPRQYFWLEKSLGHDGPHPHFAP